MSSEDDVVIVSSVCSLFSKSGGALKEIHSTDPGVIVIKETISCVTNIYLLGGLK